MNFNFNYFVIAFLTFFLFSCRAKNGLNTDPRSVSNAVPVTVTEATLSEATYFEEFPAIITPLKEIDLRPQVTGYITGIYFKDGQKIRDGQRLYSIDDEIYNANYQKAIADLQVSEANLVKVQKDALRFHELEKHDAIAKQQVDDEDAALEVARKEVASGKANVASVHSNVRFSNIYAPFDGTIGISQVKTGAAVVAGQTVLNTVSTDNPLAVDFTVDQSEIYQFIQLSQKQIPEKDSLFTMVFGNDVYPEPGRIFLIDRAVDPQTGTIKIRLLFPNDRGLLKGGMNTTVRVKRNSPANSTLIPFKAVTEMLGEFFVYLVKSDNTVTQRKVHLGRQIGTEVIVESGLNPGDKIVVEGVQNLHEGSLIKTGK